MMGWPACQCRDFKRLLQKCGTWEPSQPAKASHFAAAMKICHAGKVSFYRSRAQMCCWTIMATLFLLSQSMTGTGTAAHQQSGFFNTNYCAYIDLRKTCHLFDCFDS